MYLLFLLCLPIIGSTVLTDKNFFDTHKKCDCYYHDSCLGPVVPQCYSDYNDYDVLELYLQSSGSSNLLKICNKWFIEGIMKSTNFLENGILNSALFFSPNLDKVFSLELQLRYQTQCKDFISSSSIYSLDPTHTIKYVTVQGNSTETCKKMIELSFPYIFSGCYQIYINDKQNSEISGGCFTKPFFVNSTYEKLSLNNLALKHYTSYKSQSQELGFTTFIQNFSRDLIPDSTAVTLRSNVDFSLDDCASSGNLASKSFVVHQDGCCNYNNHHLVDLHKMEICHCKWDDLTLNCKFNDIPNGNYCIVVEFIDPRCDRSTLWARTDSRLVDCVWSFKKEAVGHVSSTDTLPYKPNYFYFTMVICISFSVLLSVFILFVIFYLVKKKRVYKSGNVFIMDKSCSVIEEFEILLLYPRECEEFMRLMTHLRILLKESCLCKIYDPWDEEMFDSVAESIEIWSLPLIKKKNVKIIVVLTECSKILEEAYIDCTHSVNYREPKLFDQIFPQSIKAINEYFSTRCDSYKRVFVVRFNEIPIIDLSFHFNCATVYILPHGLQTLINDILNGNCSFLNKENLANLKMYIEDYHSLKQHLPNYLNDILMVNYNPKIIKSFNY